MALYYEFVQNITTHIYYGKWVNFNFDKNNFIDKNWEIEISFQRKKSDNFLFNLNQKIIIQIYQFNLRLKMENM